MSTLGPEGREAVTVESVTLTVAWGRLIGVAERAEGFFERSTMVKDGETSWDLCVVYCGVVWCGVVLYVRLENQQRTRIEEGRGDGGVL